MRYRDPGGGFEVALPAPWKAELDGEGGVLVYVQDSGGLLHLMPFERESEEVTDPVEELYAFLADQEMELEEDEFEEVELRDGGSLAMCEYVSEEEDETVYWLVGVATAPGRLVFASYSCPAGEESEEAGSVRRILSSLSLGGRADDLKGVAPG